MTYKVGITDYVQPPHTIEKEAFPEAEFVFFDRVEEGGIDPKLLQELDALIVWHMPITSTTVQHLKKCKIVVRYGVGYDAIDVGCLERNNILFCNTPDYGTEEVADTACAMILGLQRKVGAYDAACREYASGWQENIQRPIRRTNKQTLGIVGVGRIGSAVVARMKAFGYRILGFDPYQPSGHEKGIGYQRVSTLAELLSQSDIVSIHCPLSDETRGMINEQTLANLKKGASIVNTSRGPVIADLRCIEQALRSGTLAAAALDVLPQEPPPNDPLIVSWRNREPWLQGRLFVNPHSSYYSEEALYEMRYKASESARLFLVKNTIRNRISAGTVTA